MKSKSRIKQELRKIEKLLNENPDDKIADGWEQALNWVLRKEKSK